MQYLDKRQFKLLLEVKTNGNWNVMLHTNLVFH